MKLYSFLFKVTTNGATKTEVLTAQAESEGQALDAAHKVLTERKNKLEPEGVIISWTYTQQFSVQPLSGDGQPPITPNPEEPAPPESPSGDAAPTEATEASPAEATEQPAPAEATGSKIGGRSRRNR